MSAAGESGDNEKNLGRLPPNFNGNKGKRGKGGKSRPRQNQASRARMARLFGDASQGLGESSTDLSKLTELAEQLRQAQTSSESGSTLIVPSPQMEQAREAQLKNTQSILDKLLSLEAQLKQATAESEGGEEKQEEKLGEGEEGGEEDSTGDIINEIEVYTSQITKLQITMRSVMSEIRHGAFMFDPNESGSQEAGEKEALQRMAKLEKTLSGLTAKLTQLQNDLSAKEAQKERENHEGEEKEDDEEEDAEAKAKGWSGAF